MEFIIYMALVVLTTFVIIAINEVAKEVRGVRSVVRGARCAVRGVRCV